MLKLLLSFATIVIFISFTSASWNFVTPSTLIISPGTLVNFQFQATLDVPSLSTLSTQIPSEYFPDIAGEKLSGVKYCTDNSGLKIGTVVFFQTTILVSFFSPISMGTVLNCSFRFHSSPSIDTFQIYNLTYQVDPNNSLGVSIVSATEQEDIQRSTIVSVSFSQLQPNRLYGPILIQYQFASGLASWSAEGMNRFFRQFLIREFNSVIVRGVRLFYSDTFLYILTNSNPVQLFSHHFQLPGAYFASPSSNDYSEFYYAYITVGSSTNVPAKINLLLAPLAGPIAPQDPSMKITNLVLASPISNFEISYSFDLVPFSPTSSLDYDLYVKFYYVAIGDIRDSTQYYPACTGPSSVFHNSNSIQHTVDTNYMILRLRGSLPPNEAKHVIQCSHKINSGAQGAASFSIELKYGPYLSFVYDTFTESQTSNTIQFPQTVAFENFTQKVEVYTRAINDIASFNNVLLAVLSKINHLYNNSLSISHFRYQSEKIQTYQSFKFGRAFDVNAYFIEEICTLGSNLFLAFNLPVGSAGQSFLSHDDDMFLTVTPSSCQVGPVAASYLDGANRQTYGTTQYIRHGIGVKCSTTRQCSDGGYCLGGQCTPFSQLPSHAQLELVPIVSDLAFTCLFPNPGTTSLWGNSCLNGGLCTNKGSTYQCLCQNGFSGSRCQIETAPICSECLHGICVANNQCNCESGWASANCDIPASPVLYGFPLSPPATPTSGVGVSIVSTTSSTQAIFDAQNLPSIPPSILPTLVLPTSDLNVISTVNIPVNSRDTIQVLYYYFPTLESTASLVISTTETILESQNVISLTLPLPFTLTSSSPLFAVIIYTVKPPGPSNIGNSDKNQWKTTWFATEFFTIATRSCHIPPNSFSLINNSANWSTTCLHDGICILTDDNYTCQCANGWIGETCNTKILQLNTVDSEANLVTFQVNFDLKTFPLSTVYFHLGLFENDGQVDIDPNGFPTNPTASTLIWLSASFDIDATQTTIPSETRRISSHIIPDFISGQVVKINIPSIFGKTLNTPVLFLQPINLPDHLSSLYKVVMPLNLPIKHRCEADSSNCSPCSVSNYFTHSGCDDFKNVVVAKQTQCAELVCPLEMRRDLVTCSCACTTQICKDRTRSMMLYTTTTTLNKSRYGKSLFYNQFTAELTYILGLNTLPLPHEAKPHHGDYIDQNTSDLDIASHVPPVGYESLLVSPITYTTSSSDVMMITITMTPFDLNQPLTPAAMNARYAYISAKLFNLFSPTVLDRFAFFKGKTNRLDLNLIPSISNTFQWVQYYSSKLTTHCKHPINPTKPSTPTCPTIAQLKTSQYWLLCSTPAATSTIFPLCVDLNGITYPYDQNSDSWCGKDLIYPDFPVVTSLANCKAEEYSPSTVLTLSLTFPSAAITSNQIQLHGNDIIDAKWTYPSNPNPTHTVSIYARPEVSFSLLNTSSYSEYDDIDYDSFHDDFLFDSSSFDEVEFSPKVQQALEKGYRVLLGTFPIKTGSASITMPIIYSQTSIPIVIIAVLNQAKVTATVGTYSAGSAPIFLSDANLCTSQIICNSNLHVECEPTTGNCVCSAGYSFSATTSTCISSCKCHNGGTCAPNTNVCQCPDGYGDDLCLTVLECTSTSSSLCSNHGSVQLESSRCGTQCECHGQWQHISDNQQCAQCSLTQFANLLCDEKGTDVARTEKQGCQLCICNKGYEGNNCSIRTMYGTISFIGTYNGTDYTNATHSLSNDANISLVRDLALSIGVAISDIQISQVLLTTSSVDAFTMLFSSQSKTTTGAVTFAISTSTTADSSMGQLYDAWNHLKDDFDKVPISDTDAKQEIGTPAKIEDAFDPVCVPSSDVTCPTGYDPFKVNDDDSTISNSNNSGKTTSAVVAIVVSIVVAALIIAILGGLLLWAKKNNKCCFAKRTKKQSSKKVKNKCTDHLELGVVSNTSDNSKTDTKTVGRSQFVTESGAIDLIEVELAPGEKPLPAGWKKMRHNVTGHTLYVNCDDMQSQKQSPVANAAANSTTPKAVAVEGYGDGW